MVPLQRPNTCEDSFQCPVNQIFFPLWPMGTCKLLALCERQGLVLSFGSFLSLAAFLWHVHRSALRLCTSLVFSLWAPSSQLLCPAHSSLLGIPKFPAVSLSQWNHWTLSGFYLPALWSEDSFRGLAGAPAGLCISFPFFKGHCPVLPIFECLKTIIIWFSSCLRKK